MENSREGAAIFIGGIIFIFISIIVYFFFGKNRYVLVCFFGGLFMILYSLIEIGFPSKNKKGVNRND